MIIDFKKSKRLCNSILKYIIFMFVLLALNLDWDQGTWALRRMEFQQKCQKTKTKHFTYILIEGKERIKYLAANIYKSRGSQKISPWLMLELIWLLMWTYICYVNVFCVLWLVISSFPRSIFDGNENNGRWFI